MTTPTPFADGVWPLLRAGWHPLPLPPRRKANPPTGTTGAAGEDMRPADLMAHVEDQPDANLATRTPAGVLGLDVDHYGDKRGGDTLAELATGLGPLPPTWWSTSRTDGLSGIRWYAVPEGLHWQDQPDVDMIRRGHRYAVVAPSVHPEGRQYRWRTPNGAWTDDPPTVGRLPALPQPWVDQLSSPDRSRLFDPLADEQVRDVLEDLPTGDPCIPVADAVAGHRHDVRRSIHGSTTRAVTDLLYLGRVERHRGVPGALWDVFHMFTRAVTEWRGSARARSADVEWRGIVRWAASRAADMAGEQQPWPCNCASVLTDLLAEETNA